MVTRTTDITIAPSGVYGFAVVQPIGDYEHRGGAVVQVFEQTRGPGEWLPTPGRWFAEDLEDYADRDDARLSIQGRDWVLTAEDTTALGRYAREA